MTAPGGIAELIERFDRNSDTYRSAQYNETQVRREFVDRLFPAIYGVDASYELTGVYQ